MQTRSGTFVRQPQGYTAFIPKPLPLDAPIVRDDEMDDLLSRADRALGRLDGSTEVLPNPELFVAMFVRQERRYSPHRSKAPKPRWWTYWSMKQTRRVARLRATWAR
jgi:hypothetical protein